MWRSGCWTVWGMLLASACGAVETSTAPPAWPVLTRESKPWVYWWWLGSAVDQTNLTRELQRFRDAGVGGVHIIPIYGAKGCEARFIEYLSPKWMEMLGWTVSEGQRLGLGVDMTTGSGWCFGGPRVTDEEANALLDVRTYTVAAGARLTERFNRQRTQALVAFSPLGKPEELTGRIAQDGSVDWSPGSDTWRVYAVSQRPSGQKVKRASPGGQGHMLNLFYPKAVSHYLEWFEGAFSAYGGPKPRAMYHDSYEYRSEWAPNVFESFAKRRGYRLEHELPSLLSQFPKLDPPEPAPDPDRVARVKCDYRETLSDLMVEETLPLWVEWSHRRGLLTRNQAHGSPGNWLDLYALADIPETEMFYKDRSKLISKFASSAAHVAGRNLVSAETGTWLKEHFTETLADMKYLADDLFLSGVNHVLYHGSCYSPQDAPWPGWLFYASYEMNWRNPVWRDVPALNAYVARCQSILQSGRPDNEVLLYWPLHDFWHQSSGLARQLTVHARDWFEDQPVGRTAELLWSRGYAFDYVSDRQLAALDGSTGGAPARTLVVPPAEHLPVETLRHLLGLVQAGNTLVFQERLPGDVPGWGNLQARREEFKALMARLSFAAQENGLKMATLGQGRVVSGPLEASLSLVRVPRERMFDRTGLMCLRRAVEDGHFYFIANRSEQAAIREWIPLARPAQSIAVLDPLSGRTGGAAIRQTPNGTEVFLSLAPGESTVLHCMRQGAAEGPRWPIWVEAGPSVELSGSWQCRFVEGGPELPEPFRTEKLGSWTELGGTNAQRFAGTACYQLDFDAPAGSVPQWRLDLGRVCQSARVRLNGEDLGTLITPPFGVVLPALKPRGNRLEVDVTSVAANRIRDLDQRGVVWKNFYDINFVNLGYKPFDASGWPLADAGLIGPVKLTPVREGSKEVR